MTTSKKNPTVLPPFRIYRGSRLHNGDVSVTVDGEPLRHVVVHSPSGFNWGYGGSGPADLALSILADFFGENPTREQLNSGECLCWQHHQRFKWELIAGAQQQGFEIHAYKSGVFIRIDAPQKVFRL